MKKFIKVNTTPLYEGDTGIKVVAHLLWGDSVRIEDAEVEINGRIKAKARGRNGFVKWDDLNDESLLEVYFIDVGQGDGILIKTPSNEHIMVDGGYKRTSQQSGKNAADFIDWKFFRDYGMDTIELDAMISSHNDSDHYGGL